METIDHISTVINENTVETCGEITTETMDSKTGVKNICQYMDVEQTTNPEGKPTQTKVLRSLTPAAAISMQHYPVVRNWGRKIRPHLDNPELQRVLVHDFNKYTTGRWGQRFRRGQFPGDFESCDWRWGVRGRHPEYYNYVKHGACHWLVNFNRALAELVEPKSTWRIITSDEHSTVWDGNETLFDLNGLAIFNGGAAKCFELAAFGRNSEVPAPREGLVMGLPWVDYAREIKGLRIKPLYHLRLDRTSHSANSI